MLDYIRLTDIIYLKESLRSFKIYFNFRICKAAAGNLLKFIPVVGSIAGGLINAGVAVAFTEALGFSVAHELKGSENADIIDLATVISNTMKSF